MISVDLSLLGECFDPDNMGRKLDGEPDTDQSDREQKVENQVPLFDTEKEQVQGVLRNSVDQFKEVVQDIEQEVKLLHILKSAKPPSQSLIVKNTYKKPRVHKMHKTSSKSKNSKFASRVQSAQPVQNEPQKSPSYVARDSFMATDDDRNRIAASTYERNFSRDVSPPPVQGDTDLGSEPSVESVHFDQIESKTHRIAANSQIQNMDQLNSKSSQNLAWQPKHNNNTYYNIITSFLKDIKAHNFPLSVSAQDLSEETVRNMFSHVVQEWKDAHNQNMYFEEEFKKEKSAY